MLALLSLLIACAAPKEGGESAAPLGETADTTDRESTADSGTDTPTDTEETDSEPMDCQMASGLASDAVDPRPGDTLAIWLSDANLPDTLNMVALDTDDGETDWDWASASGTWTLNADLADYGPAIADLTISLRAEDCEGEDYDLSFSVDWTDAERTLVIDNPAVEGSEDVAEAYAAFRGLSDAQICPLPYASDSTTMAGADFEAWMASLETCIDAFGARIQYLVPVYGVPYKVSDRIADIGTGALTTTSLDALVAMGDRATALSAAMWNPAYLDGDSSTGTYDDYVPFSDFRGSRRNSLFMVARIDGASASEAIALIDRTEEAEALAEAGALDGIVYVDGRYGDSEPASDDFGSYESGEWNMWGTRAIFEDAALYDVVWDGNAEEFGTAPAPTSCPDALYYAGWYSYYNYNDAFSWAPGAIGGHLDSCSACDIRGGSTWAAQALERGITATFGAVNEPYVAGMPEYDQFFLYLLQGASFGEAAYESTRISAWMMVWVGDPLYRPYGSD